MATVRVEHLDLETMATRDHGHGACGTPGSVGGERDHGHGACGTPGSVGGERDHGHGACGTPGSVVESETTATVRVDHLDLWWRVRPWEQQHGPGVRQGAHETRHSHSLQLTDFSL
ncbi:hypothetical protein P7K49_040180 [Saguinus oedipus]|uniref:Uncharacterized protein n=1 Tax=Saguinus oedipus TaxID=9490 RepID=A0ABQ9T8J0_SAGOE|nr:hypothetical protein P7K49_040180 [Saguinus oedipus]